MFKFTSITNSHVTNFHFYGYKTFNFYIDIEQISFDMPKDFHYKEFYPFAIR